MKFGVILPNFGKQASRLAMVDTALAAESLGFDSGWLTDHLALPEADSERFGYIFEALTTLAYLAACTSRLRLGVSALILPQRNAVEVAKEVATLDVLSGGRTMLAIGVGWSQGEFENLGYSFRRRGRRTDEAIKLLRTAWRSGQVVTFAGEYHRLEKAVILPAPLQPGGPPLWVGGGSPAALRRAALLADGWHPTRQTPEAVAEAFEKIHPLLGGRPFTIALRIGLHLAETPPPAAMLSGTSAQIIEQVRAYQAVGVSYLIVDFKAETQAGRERAMKRFAAEVMPEFQ